MSSPPGFDWFAAWGPASAFTLGLMKKTKARDDIAKAAAAMGRKGGRSKSDAKLAALKTNAKRLRSPAALKALEIARAHGAIPGERQKAWVIDQMVRQLTGVFYDEWVSRVERWDIGIAPVGAS
jgi:hypothetical protein